MPDFGIFRGFNEKLFGDKLVAGQLPTQLGLIGSEDFGIDIDALAFFARVTTAGGTLSTIEQAAVSQLVVDMKADGIWTKMKAIYPMVGASAAACSQNLKSSSFTGSFTSGWTFASTGVKPNGTSAYMDTALIGNQLTNNNHSQTFYSRTDYNAGGFQLGASNSGFGVITGFRIRLNGNFNGFSQMTTTGPFLVVSNSTSKGLLVWSRTSSTSVKAYMNNNILGTLSDVSSGDITNNNENFYLGALNSAGATQFSTNECAFASIGDGLNDTEASDFYDAVQAFQTTLNRQITP